MRVREQNTVVCSGLLNCSDINSHVIITLMRDFLLDYHYFAEYMILTFSLFSKEINRPMDKILL